MKTNLIILVLLINLLTYTTCDEYKKKQAIKLNVIKQLNSVYSDFIEGKFSANSGALKFLHSKSDNFDKNLCNNQLELFFSQFSNETDASPETWALELFDAMGKIPEGLLYGNKYALGNFDQCLRITHDTRINNIGTIRGQYCIVPMTFDLQEVFASLNGGADMKTQNLFERVFFVGGGGAGVSSSNLMTMNGFCVPDTCEPEYVLELIGGFLSDYNISIIPADPAQLCFTDSPIELTTADIFMIVIFSIVIVLMIGSTGYDAYTTSMKKPKADLFMAFSIITNGKRIFSVAESKSPDVINCLNGMRVLSLVWVIFGHSYIFGFTAPVLNMLYVADWMSNIFSVFLSSADLSVDTFFFMSGLLVTWSVFKELNKTNGKLNIPMMYLHRYLRLTPALIMTALLSVTFIKHTGIGPFSKLSQTELTYCEKWWWSALLYIQNYVNPSEICLDHSWYLQVDMHLFILSPLLLVPLWKWGRNVLPVIFTLIFLSVGCYFGTFYVNDLKISLLNGGGVVKDGKEKVYFVTHVRMGTWLIGVLLAYLLMKTKNRNIILPKWSIYGAWTISFGIMMAIIFGQHHINQPGYVEDIFESSIYSALHRVSWCTALTWIVFACCRGYGGILNSFLSHPMWLPFTRLSYSMYLLAYILQLYRAKMTKVHTYFSDYNVINAFWGDFGITFTVAIFWTLAFESPIPILEKVIFGGQKRKTQNNIVIPPTEVITLHE